LHISYNLLAYTIRPTTTKTLLLIAFAGGIVALMITAREEEPQIVVSISDVLVAAPGLSAKQVERQIATPLEKFLHQIDGVARVIDGPCRTRPSITGTFDRLSMFLRKWLDDRRLRSYWISAAI
jgi:hypothetical protein